MNKKVMGRRRFYGRITAVMMAVLLIITASPVFRITAVQAAEKAKDSVQLRIGGKKITKKTYRMKQGTILTNGELGNGFESSGGNRLPANLSGWLKRNKKTER